MEGLTPSEYASMPKTLQRKCFSTVERLRFASEQQQQQHQPQTHSKSSTPTRPRNSNSDALSSPVPAKSLSRKRGPSPNASQIYDPSLSLTQTAQSTVLNILSIPDSQVLWYFSLPAKVRKIQFSTEEQEYYELRHRQLTDAAAEQEAQFFREALEEEILPPLPPLETQPRHIERIVKKVRSTPSLPSLESAHTSITSVHDQAQLPPPQFHLQEPYRQPRRKMDDRFFESIRYFSTDSVDLALDDYAVPSPIAPAARSRSFSLFNRPRFSFDQRPSQDLRRENSLNKPELRSKKSYTSSKLSTTTTPEPPQTATFRPAVNIQIPSSSPTLRASTPTPTTETTQFNDPSSRMKLRTFASAARFDEAIEFGFPSAFVPPVSALSTEPTSPQTPTSTRNARPPMPPIPAEYLAYARQSSTSPRPRTATSKPSMFKTSFLDPEDDTSIIHREIDVPEPAPELEYGGITPSSDDEPSFRSVPYAFTRTEYLPRTLPVLKPISTNTTYDSFSPTSPSFTGPARPLTSHPVSPADYSPRRLAPKDVKDKDEDWLSGREMTLKMTLTRRDLRENDVLDNFNLERDRRRPVNPGMSMMNRAADLSFGSSAGANGEEERPKSRKGWFGKKK